MTPIDDLHVGQWVAVSDWTEEEELRDIAGVTYHVTTKRKVDGVPLQVAAISLPFVCVDDRGARYSLDVRRCQLVRLSRGYVRQMLEAVELEIEFEQEPDLSCPLCGDRLHERLLAGGSEWKYVCGECGFEGGLGGDKVQVSPGG